MAKVVKELVTKWTYKVDAKQLIKAEKQLAKLRKTLLGLRRTSDQVTKKEAMNVKRLAANWKKAARGVRSYRRAQRGGFGGGRGGRGGRQGMLGQFLDPRLMAAGAGAAGLAGGIKLAKLAGEYESVSIAMTGLIGSASGAKKVMTDLSNFAKKTPFELTGVRQTAKSLLAYGFAADEIIPTLKMLGDASMGNQEVFNRLMINFAEIRNTGRASIKDIRQFANAGIPIYQQLSKQLGKTTSEINEMVTKNLISGDIIKEAFRQMTSEGGLFFQSMELQSGTMFGIFSNIVDSLSIMGEKFAQQTFFNDLKDRMENFRQFLDDNQDGIIGDAVRTYKNFESAIGVVVKTIQNAWATTEGKVLLSVTAIAGTLALLGGPLTLALAGVAALGLAFEDLGAYMRGSDSMLGRIIQKLHDLGIITADYRDMSTSQKSDAVTAAVAEGQAKGWAVGDYMNAERSARKSGDMDQAMIYQEAAMRKRRSNVKGFGRYVDGGGVATQSPYQTMRTPMPNQSVGTPDEDSINRGTINIYNQGTAEDVGFETATQLNTEAQIHRYGSAN